MIDAAERFGQSRPAAATKKLLLVALWLAEAAAHLDRAARGCRETLERMAVGPATTTDAQQLTLATARWIDASGQLLEVSSRLDVAYARLRSAVVSGAVTFERISLALPVHAVAPRLVVARHGNGAPLCIVETPAADSLLAGARRISRGRAPPFLSMRTV